MLAWFRRWRLERATKYVLKNLSKVPQKKRGIMMLRSSLMLCCYEIDDEVSWKYVSELRKSIKDESNRN